MLAWISHELGDRDTTGRLVRGLEEELADWFDGAPPKRFYYDATWRALIGFPANYFSDTQLNDHHFHYGYFVWAAATVAALDPAFGAKARWGPMVELLVKDVANWDGADKRFPRLRNFDPYAGHSWASGPAMFDHGNNEESSSEDVNFAAAVALWGSFTADPTLRDLGTFLYETTASAVDHYWIDVDHDVFPKGYAHPVAGIVWGDGADFGTWWDPNPIYVHGINMLPWTGASLYLGRHPRGVRSNYMALVDENRGPVHQWRDVVWMYLALADPDEAAFQVRRDHYFQPEFGSSWAAVEYWVANLAVLGQVDTTVRADVPNYGVFHSPRSRTYAAYNPGESSLRVHFSDGAVLDVAPRSLGTMTHPL
jgi:endoglucanase Acf2